MPNFDLEKRTEIFSIDIISFCRKVNKHFELRPASNQLMRSATSIGANYREANGASSAKDFRNKIHLSKKETKETIYWLNIIGSSTKELKEEATLLSNRCQEFERIFGKITVTMAQKSVSK